MFEFAQTVNAADFNEDGEIDLALGLDGSGVAILFGKGDGTFAIDAIYASSKLPVGYQRIYGVAIADFDGDQRLDLAVGNERANEDHASVGLLVGDEHGHFGAPQDVELTGAGTTFAAVAAADVDHDGWQDLVATSTTKAHIFTNDQQGGFNPPTVLASTGVHGAAVEDLNGDGASDVVVILRQQGSLKVFLNDGDGAFAPGVDYGAADTATASGTNRVGLVTGDLDGDGAPELVAGNHTLSGVDVFWNQGDGTFTGPTLIPTPGKAWAVAIADLNGDHAADIAASCYADQASRLVMLANDGRRGFHAGEPVPAGGFDHAITLADFNHDGRIDVATAGIQVPNLHVWLNTTAP